MSSHYTNAHRLGSGFIKVSIAPLEKYFCPFIAYLPWIYCQVRLWSHGGNGILQDWRCASVINLFVLFFFMLLIGLFGSYGLALISFSFREVGPSRPRTLVHFSSLSFFFRRASEYPLFYSFGHMSIFLALPHTLFLAYAYLERNAMITN